ncbi:hypothetical protein AB0J90_29655 [Micromonospora sp. NPDC049523]|uniref:hypothetical protein n=1 Tax=Micromonospora sp. NPDC049523 TaxID=3155921 RepID=UPI00344251B2
MIDDGLPIVDWLLSWLPPDTRVLIALPVLVVLLFILVTVVLRALTSADRLLRPVWSALFTLTGLIAVLPEYLLTTVLRRMGQRPPNTVYLYGEIVENVVQIGHRLSQAGISSLTEETRLRRVLIVVIVGLIVGLGNSETCADNSLQACQTPVSAWWSEVSDATRSEQTVTPPSDQLPPG